MKRRSFFKFGIVSALASVLEPQSILGMNEDVYKGDIGVQKPVVISTWSHGVAANEEAWRILGNAGTALDAVEAGVRHTESDLTNHSVGISGRPDREGHVTLDACIMDDQSRCGAVAYLEGIKHPISVARAVMEHTQHVMLVGKGARSFAIDYGFEKAKTPIKEVKKDWKKWKKEHKDEFEKPEINHENHDTIGMLAIDEFGNISGSCTTSGWAYKLAGRVGDSPIIGAGLFIDNEVGGACATGMGEAIIRIAGSHSVVEFMRQGHSPEMACRLAVERIISKHSDVSGLQCGFIAISKNGQVGGYSVYNGFNYAYKNGQEKSQLIDAGFDRKW
jgi:isoaspartyl peptidase/L-asparaginase-like protein (Ntn-hydrolase superfamily)